MVTATTDCMDHEGIAIMFMETLLPSWETLSAPSRAHNVALQRFLPFLFITGVKPHPSWYAHEASLLCGAGLTLRWSCELREPCRGRRRRVVVLQLTKPRGSREEPKSLLQASRMEEKQGLLPQPLARQHQPPLG